MVKVITLWAMCSGQAWFWSYARGSGYFRARILVCCASSLQVCSFRHAEEFTLRVVKLCPSNVISFRYFQNYYGNNFYELEKEAKILLISFREVHSFSQFLTEWSTDFVNYRYLISKRKEHRFC
jgi:hypothetical protein